jgi:Recombination endonuclease VII
MPSKDSAAQKRRWRAANYTRDLEYKRQYRSTHPDGRRARRLNMRAEMWRTQEGRCYLCGTEIDPVTAVLDHDHRCCPYGTSCPLCRRGLACDSCNKLIGYAADDPDMLRRIADNLEAVTAVITVRLAQKAEQLTFDVILDKDDPEQEAG